MAILKLDGVHFSYGSRAVLAGLSLDVLGGEVLVILGASGSGKSTALRLLAGLEAPHIGTVSLYGRLASVDGRILTEPGARRLALVFQDLALWPHLTCDQHLHFVAPRLERPARAGFLSDVGLSGFDDRLPAHMSGGERQRLALARALAAEPHILLLDEPFANLDPGLRAELRGLLLELRRTNQSTIVYVTHDLEDAFALADRLAVLNQGKIEQAGAPEELYRRPASRYVSTFVGKAALLPARIEGNEVRTPIGAFENPRADLRTDGDIEVVLRPEDVEVAERGLRARVTRVEFAGDRYLVRATTDSGSLWAYSSTRFARGDWIHVRVRKGWPIERSARDATPSLL